MIRAAIILILIIHTLVSLVVFRQTSVFSVFPPFAEAHTTQIFSDLLVSISLLMVFIFREIKRKSKSMRPFLICCFAVPFVGSFAPLVFLIFNSDLFD